MGGRVWLMRSLGLQGPLYWIGQGHSPPTQGSTEGSVVGVGKWGPAGSHSAVSAVDSLGDCLTPS